MPRSRRPPLAERLAPAFHRFRRQRVTGAVRAAAFATPHAAELAYGSVLGRAAQRTTEIVARMLEGAYEPLAAEAEFISRIDGMSRSMGAAFNRARTHANQAASGIWGKLAAEPFEAEKQRFIFRQKMLLVDAARAYSRGVAEAVAAGRDPDGQQRLFRHRVRTIARQEPHLLALQLFARRAYDSGSEGGIYVTAHDERVRATHKANEGKFFTWIDLPSTLFEVNCRCSMTPVERIS